MQYAWNELKSLLPWFLVWLLVITLTGGLFWQNHYFTTQYVFKIETAVEKNTQQLEKMADLMSTQGYVFGPLAP